MSGDQFVVGVDFGTDSVRSVLVNASNGQELSSSVFTYPRWQQGLYCDPARNQFRQHPLDYTEGLEFTVNECLRLAGSHAASVVKAISVDTTGSTPVAVRKDGKPLALTDAFAGNPNAMFVLWKDHTAVVEAADINAAAAAQQTDYLRYVGGIYSSEWYWAKLLHVLRVDDAVRAACYSWVEHCDWIPFLLTGGDQADKILRGRCSAGHKALWSQAFGGYPPDSFFSSVDPLLKGRVATLRRETYTADQPAGTLSAEWASRLGLSTQVVVGTGAFDAHMGAVGGQIEPYYLSKVMGTSTCDMLVAPPTDFENRVVRGICGQVDGSVIPGMIGMEAGQSAFGDTYAWFRQLLEWPLRFLEDRELRDQIANRILPELGRDASRLPLETGAECAVDWLNGRRTPDANQQLKAAIAGLGLGSDAPRVFRALAEATCFGAKNIVDRFISEGVPVKGLIGIGGVARKSPYIMQMMADIMQMPIRIHQFEHTCALGAAMFAATAAGIYPKVEEAMAAMGGGFDQNYIPDNAKASFYDSRYQSYLKLAAIIEHQLHEKVQ